MNNPNYESIDNQGTMQQVPATRRAWLPNAISSLIIGCHSILGLHPFMAPGGIICGILAISKYKKDKPLYLANPIAYEKSYKMLKAGKITGIVGLCLGSAWVVGILFALIIGFFNAPSYDDYDPYYDDYDYYDYNDYDY